jgi:hypothetical protein
MLLILCSKLNYIFPFVDLINNSMCREKLTSHLSYSISKYSSLKRVVYATMERRFVPLSPHHASAHNPPFRNPSSLPNDGLRIKPDHFDAEVFVDHRAFYAKKRFWFNLLLFAFLFYNYLGQWLIGTYYYQAHYIGAALGDAALETACAGVKSVKNPWRNLSRKDWYRLQSCLGNEHGYERQGDLFGLVSLGCEL